MERPEASIRRYAPQIIVIDGVKGLLYGELFKTSQDEKGFKVGELDRTNKLINASYQEGGVGRCLRVLIYKIQDEQRVRVSLEVLTQQFRYSNQTRQALSQAS